jgi:hypothetical protein
MGRARLTAQLFVAVLVGLALSGCKGGTEGLGPEDHARFPIDPQSVHANIGCNACHGGFDSFQQFNCHSAGCHPTTELDPVHAQVQGYEYLSQSCYLCHPRGVRGDGVDHSIFFPIEKGSAHQSQSCSFCHATPGKPEHLTCAEGACHTLAATDAAHPNVLGYDWGRNTCLACHRNGKNSSHDHAEFFPIAAPARHAPVPCATCHQDPSDFSQITCTTGSCHERGTTDEWHAEVRGYEYLSRSCYGCHPDGQATFLEHSRMFPIAEGTPHAPAACGDCHRSPTQRKQVSCVGGECHGESQTGAIHSAVLGFEYLSPSCLACHKQGAVGKDHSSFFPIQGGTSHAALRCEVCHRDPVARKPVSCISSTCHTQSKTDPLHTAFPDYRYGSGSCLTCHAGGQKRIDHTFFPTAPGTKHQNLACEKCHTVPGDRHVLNCANALCHPASATATLHPFNNFQYSSAMCVRCHGDGAVPRIAEHLPWEIAPPAPHSRKECLLCHPALRQDRPALADFKVRYCFNAGCHKKWAVEALHFVVADSTFKADSISCLQSNCHPTGHKHP